MLKTLDYLKQYGNIEKKKLTQNINYKGKSEEQKHQIIFCLPSLGIVSKFIC